MDEQIKAMHEFDLEQFKSDRRYYSHKSDYCFNEDDDCATDNPFAVYDKDNANDQTNRFWWLDCIEDRDLYEKIMSFTESDIELISLIAFEGHSQTSCGIEVFNVTAKRINNRIAEIRKRLRPYLKADNHPERNNSLVGSDSKAGAGNE